MLPTNFAYDQRKDPSNSLIKVLKRDEMHMKLQFSLLVRIQPKNKLPIINMDMPTFSANLFLRRCEKVFNFHHMAIFSKFQNFNFVGIEFENCQWRLKYSKSFQNSRRYIRILKKMKLRHGSKIFREYQAEINQSVEYRTNPRNRVLKYRYKIYQILYNGFVTHTVCVESWAWIKSRWNWHYVFGHENSQITIFLKRIRSNFRNI